MTSTFTAGPRNTKFINFVITAPSRRIDIPIMIVRMLAKGEINIESVSQLVDVIRKKSDEHKRGPEAGGHGRRRQTGPPENDDGCCIVSGASSHYVVGCSRDRGRCDETNRRSHGGRYFYLFYHGTPDLSMYLHDLERAIAEAELKKIRGHC